MQLHYKTYGSGPENLFVLHGLFGMLDNWHNFARTLSEDPAYTVVCIDQRNHGYSPHSTEMSYELMAEDLELLRQTLHADQIHLMGHSMGGKTAMTYATLYPEHLKSLIVVDIAPKAYPAGHESIFQVLLALNPEQYESRKELEEALASGISDPAVRLFLMKNLIKYPHKKGYDFKMNLTAIYEAYPKINDEIYIPWPLSVPALFVKGEQSGYIQKEDDDKIQRCFPNSEIVSIPKAGHWVHAEQPDAFFRSIQLFLSAL